MKTGLYSLAIILGSGALVPAHAVEVIQNGDFNSGLTGWSTFVTERGTISEIPNGSTAEVVSFDVTGFGAQSALFLNAGIASPPFFGSQQGGGLIQSFTSAAGTASFSASIASFSRTGNLAGGVLSVLLDDVVLATFDFGEIASLATERGTLSFATNLSAGNHTLALQATRPFGPGRGVVSQYFTNVSLDVVPVPEPATWAMMVGGFGLAGLGLRRRNKAGAALA